MRSRAGRAQDGVMSTDTTPPPPPGRSAAATRRSSALRRSRSDRKALGVAGGLGQWAGVDPLVVPRSCSSS